LRTAAGLLVAVGAFAAVNYLHTGVFKPGWLEGRKEGEEAERVALGLPPTTVGDENGKEEHSKK
jgi:hypothetical protein